MGILLFSCCKEIVSFDYNLQLIKSCNVDRSYPHVNLSYAFISILWIVTQQNAKIFNSINSVVPLSLINSFTITWFSKISGGAPNLKLGVQWEMNCDI